MIIPPNENTIMTNVKKADTTFHVSKGQNKYTIRYIYQDTS